MAYSWWELRKFWGCLICISCYQQMKKCYLHKALNSNSEKPLRKILEKLAISWKIKNYSALSIDAESSTMLLVYRFRLFSCIFIRARVQASDRSEEKKLFNISWQNQFVWIFNCIEHMLEWKIWKLYEGVRYCETSPRWKKLMLAGKL